MLWARKDWAFSELDDFTGLLRVRSSLTGAMYVKWLRPCICTVSLYYCITGGPVSLYLWLLLHSAPLCLLGSGQSAGWWKVHSSVVKSTKMYKKIQYTLNTYKQYSVHCTVTYITVTLYTYLKYSVYKYLQYSPQCTLCKDKFIYNHAHNIKPTHPTISSFCLGPSRKC